MASSLVRSSPVPAVRIRALYLGTSRSILRQDAFSHSASVQSGVYKGTSELNAVGNPAMD